MENITNHQRAASVSWLKTQLTRCFPGEEMRSELSLWKIHHKWFTKKVTSLDKNVAVINTQTHTHITWTGESASSDTVNLVVKQRPVQESSCERVCDFKQNVFHMKLIIHPLELWGKRLQLLRGGKNPLTKPLIELSRKHWMEWKYSRPV